MAHKSLFTSRRERRLWALTLLVVATIYATLGLTAALLALLQDWPDADNLRAAGFLLAMLLAALTILLMGLRARPAGIEIGVALGIATVYFMLFVRLALTERSHLIEYTVVALLIYEAPKERAGHGRRVPVPALLAIGLTALIGVLDECIQLLLPNRVFDPQDIFFNTMAAVLAVGAAAALGWARRKARRAAAE